LTGVAPFLKLAAGTVMREPTREATGRQD